MYCKAKYKSFSLNARMEAAKKKGAKKLSDDFIAEAEKLAEQKHEVEFEKERLKIDIEYKERVVTDEKDRI